MESVRKTIWESSTISSFTSLAAIRKASGSALKMEWFTPVDPDIFSFPFGSIISSPAPPFVTASVAEPSLKICVHACACVSQP